MPHVCLQMKLVGPQNCSQVGWMSALTLQGARLRWLRRGAAAQAGLSGEISEGRREARPALASYSASPQGSGQPSRTLLEHAR